MSDNTGIEWTDATWNPTNGCSRKSPGCEHCYAEAFVRRFAGPGGRYEGLINRHGKFNGVMRLAPDHILQAPLHWQRPRRIFVNSMSDLFHENCRHGWIAGVFAIMALSPQHTFQILTKRAQRMHEFCSIKNIAGMVWDFADQLACDLHTTEHHPGEPYLSAGKSAAPWPLPNVWLGVSVEDQERADERIPLLLQTPAAVRFLSCEPLLEEIDVTSHLWGRAEPCAECPRDAYCDCGFEPRIKIAGEPAIHWIIVGGESGVAARPFVLGWAKELVKQCRDSEVAPFVKQIGANPTNREGLRHPAKDRMGGDPAEWPEELRVREFPRSAA